ncbi:MAG TPA: desulfoferrodoxin [Tenericutes bacterium]|nr:desulfoferrodoxin [Mycoplasmatota bacterium]
MKFYICRHCGNVIVKLEDKKTPVSCCGAKMELLEANTQDATLEKHVPVVEVEKEKVTVKVGSVLHPMVEEHYITFIVFRTQSGFSVKFLNPNEEPIAEFKTNEKVIEVYEYCNIHGLWKTNLE